jgi:hypothetical protein
MTVLVVGLATFGLVGCAAFNPTPCPAALYQPNTTFADGQPIVNDCGVTISSGADVANRRQKLIDFIWGTSGFPTAALPTSIDKNVASPVSGLANLERVDTLHITMDAGQVGIAHHFIPLTRKTNRLVILQQGHACTLNDSTAPADVGYGMQRTINSLLSDGYSVLALYMPHINDQLPNDCAQISHDQMFQTIHTTGSVMKFFLEPIAVSLNYLQTRATADQFPAYSDFSLAGLSGGGWTTVVYAAIDPRITLSVPVAGSLPLYLRFPASEGDTEQNLAAFYRLAGYEDLHLMGAYGVGRRQVQILDRQDSCCFGEQFHRADLTGMSYDQATRSYEWRVRNRLRLLGLGSFRLEIDEAAPEHMISWSGIANVILAELNGDRRTVGAVSTTDVFVHGVNGNLFHLGSSGWEDTGLAMVGTPATVGGGAEPANVFFRNVSNQLMRAYLGSTGWIAQSMGGVALSDPVAASSAPAQFDVVAAGLDYTLYHWWWNGTGISREQVSTTARILGQPSILAAPGRLDIFFRSFDRALYHLRKTGGGVVQELVGAVVSDFPTAVATPEGTGTTRRVYVRLQDNRVWEASSAADGPWHWAALAPVGMTDQVAGSPSASSSGATVLVQVRTTTGNLGTFTYTAGTGWTYVNNGGTIVDSPTSVSSVAYGHGPNGDLQLFTGTSWQPQGGRFD